MGIKAKPLSLVGYDDEDGDADTDAVAEAAS